MNAVKKLVRKVKDGTVKEILSELKWIYQHSLRYRWSILLYVLIGVFGVVMSYGGSVMSKFIIDTVTGYDTKKLIPTAVFFVGMQLFRILADAVSARLSARVSIQVDQQIRADVYDSIMDADWEKMSRYHSGDLLNRVDNDVSVVSSSILGWIPNLITGLVQFLGALMIILYYDPTLALISLLSAPVMFLMSRATMKKMREYQKKTREASSGVMIFNEESFHNLQVIKSFGVTDLYRKKLRRVQSDYRSVVLEQNRFSVRNSVILSVTGVVVSSICFGWGVYRLWSGMITFGTMTLFLQLSASLSASFSALIKLIPSAITAATAAGRIMAVTLLPREKRTDDQAALDLKEDNRGEGIVLHAGKMGFSYEEGNLVFRNVDFTAKPGEIIALVGPSGEGKTTMLRLILGIVSPSEGSLEITGAKTGTVLPVSPSTRSLFSYVPQGNTMFSGTVAENLRLLKQDATDDELIQALKTACAWDFIQKLPDGLETVILEKGGGFSEGQIQRLSIARALLADVPVLLFDEATSALDVATERRVLRNIMEAEKGRTCIVTTHRPSVLGVCNRVYRIQNGNMGLATPGEVQNMMMDF